MALIHETQEENEALELQSISLGLPWRILVFSIVLFAFSIFVYFGLRFGYEAYLSSESNKLDQSIETLSSEVSQQDQQDFVTFYSQLVNLKALFADHRYSTNMFRFLEKYTAPSVYFTSAKGNPAAGSIELQGKANSLDILVSQLAAFDSAPELAQKTIVNQMSFTGQEAGFTLSLFLNNDALSKL